MNPSCFSSPTLVERFWSKVDKRQPDDCWEWQGCKLPRGYGKIGSGGKHGETLLATHVAWFLSTGAPPDEFVLHKCDNPKCVNPAHLFVGTHLDNMRDQRAKDRHQHGENHQWAKLTAGDVVEIRRRRAKGETLASIADDYGVTFQNISKIAKGHSWSEL